MEFTKMHGLGNDFIIIDNRSGESIDFPDLAKKMCRRHFSVGADGILVLQDSERADLKMRIFNSDGSEAQMCGNGIRCFTRYAYENGIVRKKDMEIETLAGIMRPTVVSDSPQDDKFLVKVDMGQPEFRRSKIPMTGEDSDQVINEKLTVLGEDFNFTAVAVGNPNCVIFVDEFEDRFMRETGPAIEYHPLFPQRTNVEFVKIRNPEHILVRVWERGAGETLACGTGASAAVIAGVVNDLLERDVRVTLPGGDLCITWRQGENLIMTGPAEEVFTGVYDYA